MNEISTATGVLRSDTVALLLYALTFLAAVPFMLGMPFTGKAAYDNFPIIGEDVSEILTLISPFETPFLDLLPTADEPASNILHQWTEEQLGPDRIVNSTALNSVTGGGVTEGGIQINGFGDQLQVGMLLEIETTGEIMQINSIPGPNSIRVLRDYGSRGVSSLPAGGQLFVISTAELEGSETDGDVTRPRSRRWNTTQIFKKPIKVSGTDRAVITAPDIGDEFDHQTVLRTIELARDLEKAIFRSVRSGSTIGSDTAYRTMDGLRQYLTTVNSQINNNSFSANPLDYVNDQLQQVWNGGARDINVIAVGAQWKRELSATNAARLQISQTERGVERKITYLMTDFAEVQLVLTPWLPDRHMMGVATSRVRPTPLRGRSFQKELLAKTGDSDKGHVVGEYTLEVHRPDLMFQTRGGG
jgi:hypothetical protein